MTYINIDPIILLWRFWGSSFRGETSSFCLLFVAADSPISRVTLGGPPYPTEPNYYKSLQIVFWPALRVNILSL